MLRAGAVGMEDVELRMSRPTDYRTRRSLKKNVSALALPPWEATAGQPKWTYDLTPVLLTWAAMTAERAPGFNLPCLRAMANAILEQPPAAWNQC